MSETKLKKEKHEVVSTTNQLKLIAPDGKSRQLERNSFWFVKRTRLKREFEIYREREMRQLESDFDKAVKRLRNKKDKDDLKN